ncbi:MAG: hypothetical protein GIKADHBN_01191 [Phycisphaerales bacterium]|nr:hypothetical protein [Phycisphaerales bacterium]
MPGHPADVGRAPEDLAGVGDHVEGHAARRVDKREVAAGGVHDALGLPRRSGGVEQEEHVLGIHRLARAGVGHQRLDLVPPVEARGAVTHRRRRVPGLEPLARRFVAGAAQHEHVVDDVGPSAVGRIGELLHRLLDVLLERHHLAAAVPAVGGDDHLGIGVHDAFGDRVRRKPAEDHRVRRAQPGAREDRDRQLRHHRHVDRDDVPLLHAQALENVRHLAGFDLELAVRQPADLGFLGVRGARRGVAGLGVQRLALPDQGHILAVARLHVAIDTVEAGVELAAQEPPGVGRVPVEHPFPPPEPREVPRLRRPEAFRIVQRPLVQLAIFLERTDMPAGKAKLGGRHGREGTVLLQGRGDRLAFGHGIALRERAFPLSAA